MRELIGMANQPSTWRGVIWLLSAAGILLSQEQAAAIMAAGAAIAGVLGVFVKDRQTLA